MRRYGSRRDHGRVVVVLAVTAVLAAGCHGSAQPRSTSPETQEPVVSLPAPRTDGDVALEEALAGRRSVREFADAPLTDAQTGQLLWASQGETGADGQRTAPSAGALYPLEVYAVHRDGVGRYLPDEHGLQMQTDEDVRERLAEIAAGQEWIADAPLVLVVVGVEERTAGTYGDRAGRYVALEAGHAAQNVLLQATAMGLAAVPVGAFDDGALVDLLELPDGYAPLEVVPVGQPASP